MHDAVVAAGTLSRNADVLVDPRYDQHIRWQPDQRLDHLFEAQVDRLREAGRAEQVAVDAEDVSYSYVELEARANQVARHLATHGVRSGDRVALLCDRGVDSYLGMLAILKLNAAYVPLDAGFPPDRLAYICADAGVRTVLTHSRLRGLLAQAEASLVCLDEAAGEIARHSAERLEAAEKGEPISDLAYLIYTSGTTGRPKGVAIEHASICNFVQVAAEVYGVRPDDRIYQGMTVAFDFSVEEIWVPWMVGATLVPKPGGTALVGRDLLDFLVARRVTGLCCVPTLLATLDEDVPGLRFLLVSGEACPQDLVGRWHRPDRRFLNVYGPTEAAVTATWTPLHPDKPVTIGVPLPTYSIVVRDPETGAIVPRGSIGEICIAGVCLAAGYLNRPDLTAKAFIEAPLPIPNNPSGRLYRTGDLGRVDEHGQVEYHGRIDLQVKIRGYRIELTEIESVLMQVNGMAAAVVEPYRPEPGVVELVAYYCRRSGAGPLDPRELKQALRDRVPGYMVPAYYEELDELPLLPSNKVDRKRLPAPDLSRRLTATDHFEAADTPLEQRLADVLAEVLRLDKVSVAAHFFDDLGANSLLLARFCSRVREIPGSPAPAMKDVYLHPSVRSLAAALEAGESQDRQAASESVTFPATPDAPPDVSTARYVGAALIQLVMFAGYCWLAALVTTYGWTLLADAATPGELYTASLGFSLATFGFLLVFPILAKWVLVGRWSEREIRVWSLAYLRFWFVRMLLQINPARLFAGTPVLPLYLRLLGARIGRGVLIQSNAIPACPDLLTIGAGTTISRGVSFNCYKVEAGVIRTGRVTIGHSAFVGDQALLDINTAVGDGGQLGHTSALLPGQRIPSGEHWNGVPGRVTDEDYARVPTGTVKASRAWLYGLSKLLVPVAVVAPISIWVTVNLAGQFPDLSDVVLGHPQFAWADWRTVLLAFAGLFFLYFGGLLMSLLFVWTIPRFFNLFLKPGIVYPLYGFRYFCLRAVRRMTNGRFIGLFGDSSYITGYLSRLGYRLKPIIQTGTNFGMVVSHDVPYQVTIGSGTMVSDGLNLANAEFSSTSFRVRPTVVGRNVFVGNGVVFTPDAKVGDDCLLASHVLLPLSGEVRSGVGLLGSPAFEIPRAVDRDRSFSDVSSSPVRLAQALRAKRRFNTTTIVWFLLSHWFFAALTTMLFVGAVDLLPGYGPAMLAGLYFLWPLLGALYFTVIERAIYGFKPMQPQFCSIYDPVFWRHERFWKLGVGGLSIVSGTPFASWVWRSLGVRVGRRLFDDGGLVIEKSLTTIGDNVTINAGVTLQAHSLEEGVFKSDRISIGDGCTLGPAAFLHYGTRVGHGAVIETESFLMKGEGVPAGQRWYANPARPVPALVPAPVAEASISDAPVDVPGPGPSEAPSHLADPSELVDAALVLQPRRALLVTEPEGLLGRLRAPASEGLFAGFGVDVHLLSVAACRAHAAEVEALLTASERAEASTIRASERRLRYVTTRALIRQLVPGAARGGDVFLTTAAGGRPIVLGVADPPAVSLAYSADLIGIALSRDAALGFDLARLSEADDGAIPGAVSLEEQRVLSLMRNGARAAEFVRLWTIKEAAAKCLGTGASERFDELNTVVGLRRGGDDEFDYTSGRLRDLRLRQAQWGTGDSRHWLTVAVSGRGVASAPIRPVRSPVSVPPRSTRGTGGPA